MDDRTDNTGAWLEVVEPTDGAPLRARLGGELDVAGVAAIGPALTELLRRDAQPLCIDAAELTFCDSSGIAVLLRLANHFAPVQLEHVTPAVRRVVEVLGLSERLQPRQHSVKAVRSFPASPASLSEARSFVTEELAELPDDVRETATLLVSELATNALRHGGGSPFDVTVQSGPGSRWWIGVTDSVDGHPVVKSPTVTDVHGRGLQIVAALAAAWGVHGGNGHTTKTVWFELEAS